MFVCLQISFVKGLRHLTTMPTNKGLRLYMPTNKISFVDEGGLRHLTEQTLLVKGKVCVSGELVSIHIAT